MKEGREDRCGLPKNVGRPTVYLAERAATRSAMTQGKGCTPTAQVFRDIDKHRKLQSTSSRGQVQILHRCGRANCWGRCCIPDEVDQDITMHRRQVADERARPRSDVTDILGFGQRLAHDFGDYRNGEARQENNQGLRGRFARFRTTSFANQLRGAKQTTWVGSQPIRG